MTIPQEVENIIKKLQESGFEAYAVGGCIRDLLLGKNPKDWDVATNATPEQIQAIFPDNFYENKFGTVTVKQESNDETLREIEVTTYRIDAKYSNKRHPDSVSFTNNLEEDLARRDFTINAIAIEIKNEKLKIKNDLLRTRFSESSNEKFRIIDPFNGQGDLEKKIIRAIGDPQERFGEDALRLLRAVRFAVELDFAIKEETKKAIKKNAGWLQAIARERIRDELEKIIMSERANEGILLLHELGLLVYIIPELEKGVGVGQNRHHIYTIFEHNLLSLKFAAQKKFNLAVRLAALLHDIAKPQAKRGEGPDSTFYNHDLIGAKVAARILERLRFSKETIERVANLIRNHMFVYDIGAVTEAGVRRLLVRVGPENITDLIDLRVADRLGSGVPKAQPYRLRHFQYMVEKVQHDPISVKKLKINGNDIIKLLNIEPGPKIGAILEVLLAEVIEEPEKNKENYLKGRVKELSKVDLTQLRQMAKDKIEEKKEEEDKIIKGKYWVK